MELDLDWLSSSVGTVSAGRLEISGAGSLDMLVVRCKAQIGSNDILRTKWHYQCEIIRRHPRPWGQRANRDPAKGDIRASPDSGSKGLALTKHITSQHEAVSRQSRARVHEHIKSYRPSALKIGSLACPFRESYSDFDLACWISIMFQRTGIALRNVQYSEGQDRDGMCESSLLLVRPDVAKHCNFH